MRILALETATAHQSVALLDDQHLLGCLECDPGRPLTPQLIPHIDRLLHSFSLQMADLEGLAVSMGPGTFTGLRAGLATMTAFRMALNIPLVGVSTLEGLVWNHPPTDLPLLSTVGIRQGMVYWGLFRWEDEQVVCLKECQVGQITEICEGISEPTLMLGNGWMQDREVFPSTAFPLLKAPSIPPGPSAKGIGLGGRRLFAKGLLLPPGCTPEYIQPCYAELSKSQKTPSPG